MSIKSYLLLPNIDFDRKERRKMPDQNNKICLEQVTLVAITSVKLYETVRAIQYSMRGIEFGDVVLLSDKRPFYLPKTIRHETIRHLGNVDDYSHFCVYELADHIKTDYALIVHHDGFVVNPMAWRTEFLKYDYTLAASKGQCSV